jgi:hypothetical protein
MTQPLPPYFAEKQAIIRALFIDTADDNYTLARFCFHAVLNIDFFWLAVHCLEKYLKAALLHNGKSSKKYKHDIVELYKDVHLLAPELLPVNLSRPEGMPLQLWSGESTKDFIKRLYRNGQPNNRYQIFGYARRTDDLWKLDEVVFNVRRLCRPLEAHFLFDPRPGVPDESKRQWIAKDEHSWKLGGKLEEIIAGTHGETLQSALLDWNRWFSPTGRAFSPKTYISSASKSMLRHRLLDSLDYGPHGFAEADGLWKWVQASIQIPPELSKEIEAERKAHKARTEGLRRPRRDR